VLLVDRPASAQAELRVGAVGPARGHPDEIPALVGNAVIGGLFASRLNWELREERGWTYGVRSSFMPRRGPGPFIARTAVEPRYGVDALSIMKDQISGLARRPPGPEELDAARDTLTRGLPRQFETASQVAARAADLAVFGLPDDWWTAFARRAATVEAEEAARVAGRYLAAGDLALAVVGDADAMADGLEALGPVSVAEVP
jgi:zinc protease